jgi:hypothetical protein
MTLSRALFSTILLLMVAQPQPLRAEPLWPLTGSYEITARLELPHLERWGVDKIAIICLSNSRGPNDIPVPVVSANKHLQNALRLISSLMVRSSSTILLAQNEAPQGVTPYTSFPPTRSLVVSRW